MEINIQHGENLVITLTGRLDTVTSNEFNQAVEKETINEAIVIIDMKDLEYISSAGLRALVALKKTLQGQNKALQIQNVNPMCMEIFKVTGFVNLIDIK